VYSPKHHKTLTITKYAQEYALRIKKIILEERPTLPGKERS
jgi:hypothetical protein